MSMPAKIALVTGAGTGIGKATALALLRAGYGVVLAGRRAELLDKAVADSGALGANALAVAADVGDPTSVKALFDATQARFGRVDLLFNNAGTGAPPLPLEELSYAQWKAVVDVYLTGAFSAPSRPFAPMK